MNNEDSKDERIDSYDRDINAIVKDMHECQTTIDGIRSQDQKNIAGLFGSTCTP